MTKPWEVPELVVERGVGDYATDLWIYAGADAQVACVVGEAPGGAGAWASMFQASPTLVRALLHVSRASINERVWNDATGKIDDLQAIVRAALTKAGVPLP